MAGPAMALLPLLLSAWWADLDRPHGLMDQNFGSGLHPNQLLLPNTMDRLYSRMNDASLESYYKQLAELMRPLGAVSSSMSPDKDSFRVILDVQQFKPEEITVKLVDRFVVVEAKHEEKRDEHGLISRQFMRKYLLPEQVDEEQLSSNLSSDGILTIMAPLKLTEKPNERMIKIEWTNKPAIRNDMGGATVSNMENPITDQESDKPLETAEDLA